MSEEQKEKVGLVFRNVNTFLMSIMTAGIIWIATSVISADKKLSVMQEQVGNVKSTITKLEENSNGYYTKQEVDKEFDNTKNLIKQLREDLNLHINYSTTE